MLETLAAPSRCCSRGFCVVSIFTLVLLAGLASVSSDLTTYVLTGVFQTSSTDIQAEAAVFAEKLELQPGMTLCEMGSANGALMTQLAAYVMPGGKLVATSIAQAELLATAAAVDTHGYDASAILTTYLATNDEWAPGLPDGTCDALYSRMVIHMIPEDVVTDKYIEQWARAVKPGGRMFMTDHNPMDGDTGGPKRPIMKVLGVVPIMPVVPQDTEAAQITGGGFNLVSGPFEHSFFHNGYGAVYTPEHQPASQARGLWDSAQSKE